MEGFFVEPSAEYDANTNNTDYSLSFLTDKPTLEPFNVIVSRLNPANRGYIQTKSKSLPDMLSKPRVSRNPTSPWQWSSIKSLCDMPEREESIIVVICMDPCKGAEQTFARGVPPMYGTEVGGVMACARNSMLFCPPQIILCHWHQTAQELLPK